MGVGKDNQPGMTICSIVAECKRAGLGHIKIVGIGEDGANSFGLSLTTEAAAVNLMVTSAQDVYQDHAAAKMRSRNEAARVQEDVRSSAESDRVRSSVYSEMRPKIVADAMEDAKQAVHKTLESQATQIRNLKRKVWGLQSDGKEAKSK